ncbi:MAG: HD domain-containing protein [Kiritimatiellales bacterium]|nr:HD domain-containing protein [Kiritimatiellales bacterium]MCF7864002.1 HD domain-containing protein [Kiritimatiellales bacterium]
MNSEQLQAVRRHFIEYANGYIDRVGSMRHLMELKREHCAFVARNCRELAASCGWCPADIRTAEALGFLHDVGRFPQLAEYGTFMDAKSIDHGERGWQAIRESGLLDEVEPDLRDAILSGVRHHNAHIVPGNLSAPHYRWIELIRDADRLDIYRIILDALQGNQLGEHSGLALDLPLDGNPCPALIEKIMQRGAPSYSDLKCVADFLLLILSWSYQMNYPATLGIMRERNIVDQIAAYMPTGLPEVGSVVFSLRKTLEEACS